MRKIVIIFCAANLCFCLGEKNIKAFSKEFIPKSGWQNSIHATKFRKGYNMTDASCGSLCLNEKSFDCNSFRIEKDAENSICQLGTVYALNPENDNVEIMVRNDCSEKSPCKAYRGFCNFDNDCQSGLKCVCRTCFPDVDTGKVVIISQVGNEAKRFPEVLDVFNFETCPFTPLICEDFPKFPSGDYGTAGGFIKGPTPLLCGGNTAQEKCYLVEHGEFVESNFSMSLNRRFHEAIVTFDNEGIFILGGGPPWSSADYRKTEYVYPDKPGEMGPLIPHVKGLTSPCMVKLNSTMAMLTGGNPRLDPTVYTKETYFFDGTSFTPGPDMSIGRQSHGCAMLWDREISSLQYVIVTGGHTNVSHTKFASRSTEIWDSLTNTWFDGPDIPNEDGVRTHTMVTSLDGSMAMVIGGFDSNQKRMNIMHRLTCSNRDCEWKTLQRRVKEPIESFVAGVIPSAMAKCT